MKDDNISSLAALMEDVDNAGQSSSSDLPMDSIRPDPDQPRRTFDETKLEKLADSIKAQGVIQPIVVRPDEGGGYIIAVGERRWRAAQIAGLSSMPVVIREVDENTLRAMQLIENIDREGVPVLEEAAAVERLCNLYSKVGDVAKALGKAAAWVSQRRKIAKGLMIVQAVVDSGATRDPETLSMLIDLYKLDKAVFAGFSSKSTISRARVRDALNVAKERSNKPDLPDSSEPDSSGHNTKVADSVPNESDFDEKPGQDEQNEGPESEKQQPIREPDLFAQGAKKADFVTDLIAQLGASVEIFEEGQGGYIKISYRDAVHLNRIIKQIQ